jgi:predicted RND superfamily exporter protein
LYIEPKSDLWKRENLSQFMQEVEARVATVPGAPSVTGIASDIYHSTASIQQAFYHATAYALILIFMLVLIDLRNITHTLIAVSVLALGLPMLVAVMGLKGESWNFANFFGLPILIGAGHEYGVFMMHRYREAIHNPRRVWRRWDPADRALLLCAFVTCSSFGFFWLMSSHKGLKSLGWVMMVGTLCIYLAAVIVVRSLLTWMLDRRAREAASGGFAVGEAGRVEDEAANRP